MSTKSCNLSNYKLQTFAGTNFPQFTDLNLNENYKCSKIDPFQSKIISNKNGGVFYAFNKPIDFNTIDSRGRTKDLWNKFGEQQLSLKFAENSNIYDSEKVQYEKQWKNDGGESSTKSSTLSLHIAAYENAVEDRGDSDAVLTDEKLNSSSKLGKTWKNAKQLFAKSSPPATTSCFEIPRQQTDSPRTPEIFQFKTSQRMFNPNSPGTPKPKTSEKG
uniref:Uncharacterized protein n=1 Tax=Panagrolaimus sp. ES5 TaxID=591445 RepID=A0AC34G3H1_9BILA